MESWVIVNFFIALAIGAIIGLEREIIHQKFKTKDFGGVRNFILIALFGFLITYFSIFITGSQTVLVIGFISLIVLITSAYVVLGMKAKRFSTTSEIAALITFALACFVGSTPDYSLRLIAIIATVIVASLLAFKEGIHNFAKRIEMHEVFATVKMAIISVIILPLLPNKNYTLLQIPLINELFIPGSKFAFFLAQLDVFNPFKIWLIVVFITGLSYIGYLLVRIIGEKKGLGLTGLIGGLVSSTAVTVSMSKKSKGKKNINGFALAILLASSVMFLRVLLEVLVVNRSIIGSLAFPLGIMAVVGFGTSIFLLFQKGDRENKKELSIRNPFELNTAIKFGLFFLLILVLSKTLFILLGDVGIYLISIFSGLADVDAITITVSSLASSGLITSKVAVIAITLGVATNTLVKAGIVRVMGERRLAKKIMWVFSIILILGIILALLV